MGDFEIVNLLKMGPFEIADFEKEVNSESFISKMFHFEKWVDSKSIEGF